MTPACFLSPRPGELLYSALARTGAVRGALGPKALMAGLFGKPNAIATADLPNNLAALVAKLPAEAGLDLAKIAASHTLLPYYTRFQPAYVRDRALAAMAGPGGSVHLILGVPTFRTGRPTHLQFCPSCLVEMDRIWGSWHWRRCHQLPGLLVCPDHGCRMRRSSVRLASTNRHEFVPPSADSCASDAHPVTKRLGSEEWKLAMAVASASAALLDDPGVPLQRGEQVEEYRRALGLKGMIKGRFKVDQAALSSRLAHHFGPFLTLLDGVGLSGVGVSWLASLVRPGAGAQPPLQHVLLRLFLMAQPDLPPRSVRINPPRHRDRPIARASRDAAPALRDWQSIDLSYAAELRRAAREVRADEPPRRVSLCSMESVLGRRDWLSKRRSKLPMASAAAAALTEAVPAFQLRRLRWHALHCRDEGIFDPWVLVRRAGLRGSMIALAREALDSLPLESVSLSKAA